MLSHEIMTKVCKSILRRWGYFSLRLTIKRAPRWWLKFAETCKWTEYFVLLCCLWSLSRRIIFGPWPLFCCSGYSSSNDCELHTCTDRVCGCTVSCSCCIDHANVFIICLIINFECLLKMGCKFISSLMFYQFYLWC